MSSGDAPVSSTNRSREVGVGPGATYSGIFRSMTMAAQAGSWKAIFWNTNHSTGPWTRAMILSHGRIISNLASWATVSLIISGMGSSRVGGGYPVCCSQSRYVLRHSDTIHERTVRSLPRVLGRLSANMLTAFSKHFNSKFLIKRV